MPNENITGLPTDETLENGLRNIENAIGGSGGVTIYECDFEGGEIVCEATYGEILEAAMESHVVLTLELSGVSGAFSVIAAFDNGEAVTVVVGSQESPYVYASTGDTDDQFTIGGE